MPVVVFLMNSQGAICRALKDPNGGTFDAAGDFDRFLDDGWGPAVSMELPTLRRFEPLGDSCLGTNDMSSLLTDVRACLEVAQPGPEQRGLLRLSTLADECSTDPGSSLVCQGD